MTKLIWWDLLILPICCSTYAASSCVALGIIPGSVREVRSKVHMVNRNNTPPIIGINTETFLAKYGQLEIKILININNRFFTI